MLLHFSYTRTIQAGVMRTSLALWSLKVTSRLIGSVYGSLVQGAPVRGLRLCVFRGRSRHTIGFEPTNRFELPTHELLAAADVDHGRKNGHRLSLQPTLGSEVFHWVESSLNDAEIAQVASRCVLLHGVFEVWGKGKTKEEAATDLSRSCRIPEHLVDASWSLSGMSYGSPQLTREEEEVLVGGPVLDTLLTQLRGPRTDVSNSDMRIHVVEDLCPPPLPHFFAANGRKRSKRKRDVDTGCRETLQRARVKEFFICRVLQLGPAVGLRAVLGRTWRRPKSGILNVLALNGRKCKGSTPIEPEVALVMANLAKVRPGSFILDPFCGSCSLLLPAANMGARTWGADIAGPAVAVSALRAASSGGDRHVDAGACDLRGEDGTDGGTVEIGGGQEKFGSEWSPGGKGQAMSVTEVDLESLRNLQEDFQRLGLGEPELVMADITDAKSSVRRPDFYDAIITDPPYNVKERVQAVYNHQGNTAMFVNSAATQVHDSDGEVGVGARKRGDNSIREPVAPVEDPKERLEKESRERGRGSAATFHRVSSGNRSRRSSWGCDDLPDAATVVAQANGLVGEVVLSLLSMARYALKPGGRLVFFLPLRDADARLDRLPSAVLEKFEDESGVASAEGKGGKLSVVYAAKQHFTSPNICRWLVVLEKEAVPREDTGWTTCSGEPRVRAHGRQGFLSE